jgi:hypothetical protein
MFTNGAQRTSYDLASESRDFNPSWAFLCGNSRRLWWRRRRSVYVAATLSWTALIVACGGGGGGSNTPAPAPDFSVSASTTSLNVIQGATSTPVTVSVTAVNGFTSAVSVAIAGLPTGSTTTPAFPLSVSPNSPQQFTVTMPANTPLGNSTITLTGTSGSLTHSTAPITLTTTAAIQTSQSNGVMYLQSYANGHTARIGLNTAWGGAIVEVSLDGTNFVNAHDTGREVQPALYDGAATYTNFNCSPCSGTWGWDPVLAGDKYGHGSPVLSSQLGTNSIDIKAQPLQWVPDDKGGGPNTPITSDTYMEQTVSVVPDSPLAFHVHVVMTHISTDQHYNANQEFPAIYVNSQYGTFTYYSGTKPWTSDVTTTLDSVPASPGTGELYSSEEWVSYTGSNNSGLTVFVPGLYPFTSAVSFPGSGGSGPTGDATYYAQILAPMTIGPSAVISGDIYLIPGDVAAARQVIYALHQGTPASDIASPIGNVDLPNKNSTISGSSVQFAGWAIDNVALASVQILVDGVAIATPPLNVNRPDVVAAYPNLAPLQCGWSFLFDSTKLTDGTHTITANLTDTSNNVAVLPPVTVTVSN